MQYIKNTTLCCIDCLNYTAALRAIQISINQCQFEKVLFFSDLNADFKHEIIQLVKIDKITSREEYSQFILNTLLNYIDSDFVLIIQWDGYIVNPKQWNNIFFEYDYIGAKWEWFKDSFRVGNGGFSLRSKKLLNAIASLNISINGETEDTIICRHCRKTLEDFHQVKFAPEHIADLFSFERTTFQNNIIPFGFHGMFNMHFFLKDLMEITKFINELHPKTFQDIATFELAINYYHQNNYDACLAICHKIIDYYPNQHRAFNLLGLAAFHKGQKWLAIKALQEAIELSPENTTYQHNLQFLLKIGRDS